MHHCNFETLEDINNIIEKKTNYQQIFDYFNDIIHEDWCDSIKLGSEVEDNSFEELEFVKTNFVKKLRFKIGGCGAKNDIRTALKNKVDIITLPMAESRYAIENFLDNLQNSKFKDYEPILSLNIETITIVDNLPKVLDLLKNFKSFTIGRSDLSGSMKVNVNDPSVDNTIVTIIKLIKSNFPDSKISIGGKITPKSASHLIEKINENFDFINTKFIYIKNKKFEDANKIVLNVLKAEIALFSLFHLKGFRTKEELIEFAKNNFKRMLS